MSRGLCAGIDIPMLRSRNGNCRDAARFTVVPDFADDGGGGGDTIDLSPGDGWVAFSLVVNSGTGGRALFNLTSPLSIPPPVVDIGAWIAGSTVAVDGVGTVARDGHDAVGDCTYHSWRGGFGLAAKSPRLSLFLKSVSW